MFKISASGALTRLYSFTGGTDGAIHKPGWYRAATAILRSNGIRWNKRQRDVCKSTASGAFTLVYTFNAANDGANPQAALVQGGDGNFYGTSWIGGTNGNGTVFKISVTGRFSLLYTFSGSSDGGSPQGALVQGSDGNFYGTTDYGGTNNVGTIFKISAGGAFFSLYSFTGASDGAYPEAGLVQGNDGNFYGTTSSGGTNNAGTVFKINSAGAFTLLYTFSGG